MGVIKDISGESCLKKEKQKGTRQAGVVRTNRDEDLKTKNKMDGKVKIGEKNTAGSGRLRHALLPVSLREKKHWSYRRLEALVSVNGYRLFAAATHQITELSNQWIVAGLQVRKERKSKRPINRIGYKTSLHG
jgi:hypothetical protein